MNDKTAKIDFSIQLEAKACPFCGSWKLTMEERENSDWPLYVFCDNCGSTGPSEPSYTRAIERWNERKAPDPVPGEESA